MCEKHGFSNVYKFVEVWHHAATWKSFYENVVFLVATRSEIDDFYVNARLLDVIWYNLEVLKALPPPRGRSVKHAGKHRKGRNERGLTQRSLDVTLLAFVTRDTAQ